MLRHVEQAVLKNYIKHSPSKLPLEDGEYRKNHIRRRERLFVDRLKLPTRLFDGSSVLDFGCGTGEQDICYAMWGGNCTLVDMNPISTDQAKKYFDMFHLTDRLVDIHTKSIFEFEVERKYDIVISEGVLHVTDDPRGGFDNLVDHLKDGGFIVLQLPFDVSNFQRSVHRMILDYLTDGSEGEIVRISKILFHETLERSSRFGGRSIDQIVYDFYTNPTHKGISIYEIFRWFRERGITYYSSYPVIEMEGLINGTHKPPAANLIAAHPYIVAFTQLLFMIAREDDEEAVSEYLDEGVVSMNSLEALFAISQLRDYQYGAKVDIDLVEEAFTEYIHSMSVLFKRRSKAIGEKMDMFMREYLGLLGVLRTRDLEAVRATIDSFNVLFRGYSGVPSNYIVGYSNKGV